MTSLLREASGVSLGRVPGHVASFALPGPGLMLWVPTEEEGLLTVLLYEAGQGLGHLDSCWKLMGRDSVETVGSNGSKVAVAAAPCAKGSCLRTELGLCATAARPAGNAAAAPAAH